jgi:hypothetical protein
MLKQSAKNARDHVTHNRELAERFRHPLNKLKTAYRSDSPTPKPPPIRRRRRRSRKKRHEFFDGLHISFNNLLTKKGRTVMTAFAGSIASTGGLVLAFPWFYNYIHKMESDLVGIPIAIIASPTISPARFPTRGPDVPKTKRLSTIGRR